MRLTNALSSRLAGIAGVSTILTVGLLVAWPASADSGGGQTLRIGVGHTDPDNQQFDPKTGSPITGGRVWSYTDFFTRDVTIHSGDTLDFQTPPNEFHAVALARDGAALRASAPIFVPDVEDPVAAGSGAPRALFGPGAATLFSSPTCGIELVGMPNCNFDGTTPVLAGAIGGAHVKKLFQVMLQNKKATPATYNGTVDWNVTVNAPPGDYNYLCLLHPKMNGTLHVVPSDAATSTQGTINSQSLTQFAADKAEGQARYATDNSPTYTTDATGHKVWNGHAGDNTADGHVSFFEMMPRNLTLGVGDSVHWTWGADAEIHTVSFPANSPTLLPPFMPDCGQFGGDDFALPPPPSNPTYCGDLPPSQAGFELTADPGTARPGVLSDPASLVDSGVLVGADYGLLPSVQDWSATANVHGTYAYQCTIHDWMQATVTVN